MRIIRPSKQEVESWVNIQPLHGFIEPKKEKEEWDKDHWEFVLKYFLPTCKPNLQVWRITAEAYLTRIRTDDGIIRSFEQEISDGSTIVPDISYKWGAIKDPWAVAHDLIYILKKMGLKDVYGNKWTYLDSQKMYRDGWWSQKFYIIGTIRWLGLLSFGWIFWNKKINSKIKKIKIIVQKSNKKV